jgi:hypothetical protein
MTELIMSKDTVITVLNLFPKIDSLLEFDQRIAIQKFLYGKPTDEQQIEVLGICRAIMDTNPIGRVT